MKLKNTVCLILLSISLTAHAEPNKAVSDDEFAWKLAALEEGRPLDGNSLEVNRAKNALKIAMTVCNEKSEQQLGEQAWRVTQIMRKDNVYARPVDILEGLKAVLDGTDKKQDCADIMARYASGRIGSGQSHSEAVAGFRTIMKMTGDITYSK